MHTLEIDSVILEFGSKRVLQDVYLKCETGKIAGMLGRNGSGKTCLMNIAYGQLIPGNHSLRIDKLVQQKSYRSPRDMMYLSQLPFIPLSLTLCRVFKDYNLDFGAFVADFPEFEKHYNSRMQSLSGGEQRIVEIYLILASKTKFCLLDEPFSHIMPVHIEKIKNILSREKQNKGILITDHLYEHILDVCDDLYILKDGKTYLTKTPNDLEMYGYSGNRIKSQKIT
jgi:ABC-type lipopolysaccharide export system ATPase subunit